ncbi:hypothetical protein HDZ31DRAFT_65461 [Schizophyllum fasciatum]
MSGGLALQAKRTSPDTYDPTWTTRRSTRPIRMARGLGSDARAWNVCNDEAQEADAELVKGLNATIDALLVFAGLFSAVGTTSVAQSSQKLEQDHMKRANVARTSDGQKPIIALSLLFLAGLPVNTTSTSDTVSIIIASSVAIAFAYIVRTDCAYKSHITDRTGIRYAQRPRT